MNPQTLLHRLIHHDWMKKGQPTSQAFKPAKKDAGRLSVFTGDPQEAWNSYFAATDESVSAQDYKGVMSVAHAECAAQYLDVEDDPQPGLPEHAVIIFGNELSRNQARKRAQALKDHATKHGWQYKP